MQGYRRDLYLRPLRPHARRRQAGVSTPTPSTAWACAQTASPRWPWRTRFRPGPAARWR